MPSRLKVPHSVRPASRHAARDQAPPLARDGMASGGQLLDRHTQARMSASFGHNFSQVRVHTDSRAGDAAEAVGADAFALGGDIVFGAGKYQPGSRETERLLAHELTHVAQQARSGPGDPGRASRKSDASEREAEQASLAVTAGGSVRVSAAPDAAIARTPVYPWVGDPELPSAVSDNIYEYSSDALTGVDVYGGDDPAQIMHHDNMEFGGVKEAVNAAGKKAYQRLAPPIKEITVADHADVIAARAQIEAGGGPSAVGGLKQGSMIPDGVGRSTDAPLWNKDGPFPNQPMPLNSRTHAESPKLSNPTDPNYNPDAYSANNPVSVINTKKLSLDPDKVQFGPKETPEAHMPTGGRDRGASGLGETPDAPAGTGEYSPPRAAPEPGDYRFSQPEKIGPGPTHQVYGRPGDRLPEGWDDDLEAMFGPTGGGTPGSTPPTGGAVPDATGGAASTATGATEAVEEGAGLMSRLGKFGPFLRGASHLLAPAGAVLSAVSLSDHIRHGQFGDAAIDTMAFASAGVGTVAAGGVAATSLGATGLGSALTAGAAPLAVPAAVAGSFAAGYGANEWALGKANNYSKNHEIFGTGDDGQARDSTEAAGDVGQWVDDKVHSATDWIPGIGHGMGSLIGGPLGALSAMGASVGTELYAGGHAAVNGIERAGKWAGGEIADGAGWLKDRIFGEDVDVDKDAQNKAQATLDRTMDAQIMGEERDELYGGGNQTAHDDPPPPPPAQPHSLPAQPHSLPAQPFSLPGQPHPLPDVAAGPIPFKEYMGSI